LLPLFLVLNVGWVAANAVGHTHTTCEGAVCRALVANSEAIMEMRKEIGCCTHQHCSPGDDSPTCTHQLVMKMQHCLQIKYEGDRGLCIHKAIMPRTCQHMVHKCEGLKKMSEHLQLAASVVGCSMREGMWWFPVGDVNSFLAHLIKPSQVAEFIPPIITQAQVELELKTAESLANGVALVGGQNTKQGNVYVYDPNTGRWGAVCDTAWTRKNADVICRQMGFNDAARHFGQPPYLSVDNVPAVERPGSRFGKVPSPFQFLFNDAVCFGDEIDFRKCPGITDNGCQSGDVAGVECS